MLFLVKCVQLLGNSCVFSASSVMDMSESWRGNAGRLSPEDSIHDWGWESGWAPKLLGDSLRASSPLSLAHLEGWVSRPLLRHQVSSADIVSLPHITLSSMFNKATINLLKNSAWSFAGDLPGLGHRSKISTRSVQQVLLM